MMVNERTVSILFNDKLSKDSALDLYEYITNIKINIPLINMLLFFRSSKFICVFTCVYNRDMWCVP